MLAYMHSTFKADSNGTCICIELLFRHNMHCSLQITRVAFVSDVNDQEKNISKLGQFSKSAVLHIFAAMFQGNKLSRQFFLFPVTKSSYFYSKLCKSLICTVFFFCIPTYFLESLKCTLTFSNP